MTDSECTPESVPVVDGQFICIHRSNTFYNVNCECNRTKGFYGDPLFCKRIKEACGIGLELKCDGSCKDCEAGYHKPYSNMDNNLCQWLQTSFDKTSTTSLSSLVTQGNTSTTTTTTAAPQTGSEREIILGVSIGVPLAIIILIVVVVIACILKRRRTNLEKHARTVYYAGHNSHDGMESQVLIENGNGVLRSEDQAASETYPPISSVSHSESFNEQQQQPGSAREVQERSDNKNEGDGYRSHSGEHHRNGDENRIHGGEHHSKSDDDQNHDHEHPGNGSENHNHEGEYHSIGGEHQNHVGEHQNHGGEHQNHDGEHQNHDGEHHSSGGEHHNHDHEHPGNSGKHHNHEDEHHSSGGEHQSNGHIRDQHTDRKGSKPVQRVPPIQQVNAQQRAQGMPPTPVPVVIEMPPTPVPVVIEIPLEPVVLGSAPTLTSLIDERQEVERF